MSPHEYERKEPLLRRALQHKALPSPALHRLAGKVVTVDGYFVAIASFSGPPCVHPEGAEDTTALRTEIAEADVCPGDVHKLPDRAFRDAVKSGEHRKSK